MSLRPLCSRSPETRHLSRLPGHLHPHLNLGLAPTNWTPRRFLASQSDGRDSDPTAKDRPPSAATRCWLPEQQGAYQVAGVLRTSSYPTVIAVPGRFGAAWVGRNPHHGSDRAADFWLSIWLGASAQRRSVLLCTGGGPPAAGSDSWSALVNATSTNGWCKPTFSSGVSERPAGQ